MLRGLRTAALATVVVCLGWEGARGGEAEGIREGVAFTGHSGAVRAVAFLPNGRQVASGGDDELIWVWDLESGQELKRLSGNKGAVMGIDVSHNGRRLASASLDKSIRVFDLATGRMLHARGVGRKMTSVAFAPNGSQVVAGGYFGETWLLDARTGGLVGKWAGKRRGRVLGGQVAWSPRTPLMAAAGGFDRGQLVILTQMAQMREFATLSGHTDIVLDVAFAPNGAFLASGASDGTVRVWRVAARQASHVLDCEVDHVTAVAFYPSSRYLVAGGSDGTFRVWDLNAGGEPLIVKGHDAVIRDVAVSRDGQWLATASEDGMVKTWRVPVSTLEEQEGGEAIRPARMVERELQVNDPSQRAEAPFELGRQPLTFGAWAKPVAPDGVVIAQGGDMNGAALYIKGGIPRFVVRTAKVMHEAEAHQRLMGDTPAHLVGSVDHEGMMRLFVNGELWAEERGTLVEGNSSEGLSIARDEGTNVGDYSGDNPFPGSVWDIRVFDRALDQEDVKKWYDEGPE